MPITNPTQNTNFNASYDVLGEYVSDGSRIPWYNSTALLVQPGEPLLIKWGASGEERVYLAQGPIRPGEVGMLVRPGDWVADLPASLSASIAIGDELYWDEDNSVVSLVGDVTNGFVIGDAGYALDPNQKNATPAVDGNGRVVAGTTASTKVRVVSRDQLATTKGTVTVY